MSQGWNWTGGSPTKYQGYQQQPQQQQQQQQQLQPICSAGQPSTEVIQHHNQHSQQQQQQSTPLPSYKSDLGRKELEDSSAVVSSTQDEPDPDPHVPGSIPGSIPGSLSGSVPGRFPPVTAPTTSQSHHQDDQLRATKQDHFGNLIGIISELQESPCSENDIYQLISGGEYSTEIKTESGSQYDAITINSQQTELEYLSQQELHSSSYNRQHSGENGYNTRYRDEGMYGMQYPTHLPLKGVGQSSASSSADHTDRLNLYSPVSPEPSQDGHEGGRPRDDKYWERRRKNNLAAKKSRDARRVRENQLRLRVLCSENQIRILRSQLEQAKESIQDLKKQLRQYEGDTTTSNVASNHGVLPANHGGVPGNHEVYENMETGGGGHEYHDLEPPDKDRMDRMNGEIKLNNSGSRYQDLDTRYSDHIVNGGVG